jgi:hypothetical protein
MAGTGREVFVQSVDISWVMVKNRESEGGLELENDAARLWNVRS